MHFGRLKEYSSCTQFEYLVFTL